MDARLTVYRKSERSGFPEGPYTPGSPVLAVVAEGSLAVEDETGPWIVGPQEAFLFLPGHAYVRSALSPLVLHVFRFTSEEDLLPGGMLHFSDPVRVSSTLMLLDKLHESVGTQDYLTEEILLRDLILQYQLENGSFDPEKTADSLVGEAAFEIRRRMRERVNLTEIAEKSGLSYVHFARRFKAAAGAPPSVYLNRLRLAEACRLLAETDLPVKEIAPRCGFSNEYYFSSFFREHSGLAPTEYRAAAAEF